MGPELSKIVRVFTDTHGFSADGGSLGWLEGILLCPRLKRSDDVTGQRFVASRWRAEVTEDAAIKAARENTGWPGT